MKLVIPKGRIYDNVVRLLSDSGYKITANSRSYRPYINCKDIEVKILKPQNIAKLVELGSHDIGFTGLDWIVEQKAEVKELLDLGFDPVRLVVAIPKEYNEDNLKKRKIIVASEYERITKKFLKEEGFDSIFVRTFGATEVFPPEDADLIVDNTATGMTLEKNDLKSVRTLMKSTTRFIANKESLKNKWKLEKINELVDLFKSVLEARKRVFLEMNVTEENFERLLKVVPAMKSPTISKLYGGEGYAIKAAVEREKIPELLPKLKKNGATDILEFELEKVMV